MHTWYAHNWPKRTNENKITSAEEAENDVGSSSDGLMEMAVFPRSRKTRGVRQSASSYLSPYPRSMIVFRSSVRQFREDSPLDEGWWVYRLI